MTQNFLRAYCYIVIVHRRGGTKTQNFLRAYCYIVIVHFFPTENKCFCKRFSGFDQYIMIGICVQVQTDKSFFSSHVPTSLYYL